MSSVDCLLARMSGKLFDLGTALGGGERGAGLTDEHVLLGEELLVVEGGLAADDDDVAVEEFGDGVDLRIHVADDFGYGRLYFSGYEIVAEGFECGAGGVGFLGGDEAGCCAVVVSVSRVVRCRAV